MADGYARIARGPASAWRQVIGAANLAAGLRDAHLAHSPVIAFTGGRDPSTKFRKVYQEVDDVPAFEAVTKFNATVDDVDRIPDMVRQAFRVATTGSPGPVHLQFRGNEGQVDAGETDEEPLVETQFATVPPVRSAHRRLDRASPGGRDSSQRPTGRFWSPAAASGPRGRVPLVALAEKLSIPVATSLNGKDTIGTEHPLSVGVVGTYSRARPTESSAKPTLVCYVGSETGGMTTHFWQVPRSERASSTSTSTPKPSGGTIPPLVGIQGDARSVLS